MADASHISNQFLLQQELLDCLPSATILIRGNEIYLNQKAEEITGYKTGDFSNLDEWFKIIYGEASEQVRNYYEADRRFRVIDSGPLSGRTDKTVCKLSLFSV